MAFDNSGTTTTRRGLDQDDPNVNPNPNGSTGPPPGQTPPPTPTVPPSNVNPGPGPEPNPNPPATPPPTPPFNPGQTAIDLLNQRMQGGRPTGTASADQLRAYVLDYAKNHPNSNPSLTRDPDYWVRRMMETHPNGNVDYGYWESRFDTPEGPPEGARGPGGPTGGFSPTQALQISQQRLGRQLSRQELDAINARFGFDQNTQFTTNDINNALAFIGGGTQFTDDGPDGRGIPLGPDGRPLGPTGQVIPNRGGPGPGNNSIVNSDLYRLLMQRANGSLNIDPNDPIIAGQVNAARAENTRGARNTLSQLAEHGGPENNMAGQTRSVNERANQNTTNLQASIMQNELTARRQEIAQALSTGASMLTESQRLDLQRQLGILDAALRQQQIGNQNSQFYSGLGQNQDQFLRNLMLQYGYLNSQNDQFSANYNLNATDRANYWDALRRGLL